MGEIAPITKNETPRIYVACLAAYNSGYLHGSWIDAAQDAWAIYDDVKAMLATSPIEDAEEWAIHDYEGFGNVRISEYASFDHVSGLAAFIEEHGELGLAVLDYTQGEIEEAREVLEDRYLGTYEELADYVQEVTEDTTTIPQRLAYYIDWQAMARDAEMSGDVFTVQTAWDSVHVFAGC
ncbi:antirestriction protein ArdA [Sphingobium baderi]|uniref:antirestriction protein ArdA n=1 Tax=Sphingobium baderi TaxID=1332080 RepID=UPI002B414D96|nr:antirestriction protein ArdA [Sphingobium baderi]WRD75290.1 antirestriction protein ArdA [Sphingobium baderi]